MSTQETRQQRLEKLMNGQTDGSVASCDQCGGTFFYNLSAEQYIKGYGSVEYSSTGANARTVKVCLCGNPLPSKSTVRTMDPKIRAASEEFTRSLGGARQHRTDNAASEVAKKAATPKELDELKQLLLSKIKEVEDALAAVKTAKAETKSSK